MPRSLVACPVLLGFLAVTHGVPAFDRKIDRRYLSQMSQWDDVFLYCTTACHCPHSKLCSLYSNGSIKPHILTPVGVSLRPLRNWIAQSLPFTSTIVCDLRAKCGALGWTGKTYGVTRIPDRLILLMTARMCAGYSTRLITICGPRRNMRLRWRCLPLIPNSLASCAMYCLVNPNLLPMCW